MEFFTKKSKLSKPGKDPILAVNTKYGKVYFNSNLVFLMMLQKGDGLIVAKEGKRLFLSISDSDDAFKVTGLYQKIGGHRTTLSIHSIGLVRLLVTLTFGEKRKNEIDEMYKNGEGVKLKYLHNGNVKKIGEKYFFEIALIHGS